MSKTEEKTRFRLVLASQSPRRKELISWLKIPFEIKPSEVEEVTEKTDPAEVAEDLARLKGEDVWNMLDKNENPYSVVVSSDTVVSLNGVLYGKPRDRSDAGRMLKELAGKTHQVFTGVFIKAETPGGIREHIFSVKTDVTFETIDEISLELYLDTGESLDKAGAYGIQGQGLTFISRIDGSYSNVVGFPLSHFSDALPSVLFEGPVENWRDFFV